MNSGKYVFSQVMEYFPFWVFDDAVKEYKGDYRMRMSCSTQCKHLLFGQLAGCKSLNEIELILKADSKALYHLGFDCTVDSSSLSRANETRDYRIYERLGQWLIKKVRPLYAKENIPDIYLPGWEILAIDSTTISCSVKIAEWALGKYSKGGLKCIRYWICEAAYPIRSTSPIAGSMTATSWMNMSPTNGPYTQWIKLTWTLRRCTLGPERMSTSSQDQSLR